MKRKGESLPMIRVRNHNLLDEQDLPLDREMEDMVEGSGCS